jgi:molecular chaperone DnaK (HSP70)
MFMGSAFFGMDLPVPKPEYQEKRISAIGIDLGSTKAVMGTIKEGAVDIVLSDTSNRSVPF